MPAEMKAELQAWLDERAAIREYDGEQSREEAERGALDDLRRAISSMLID